MFWRKRKEKCNHEWHYVKGTYITIDYRVDVETIDGTYIYCPKCRTEDLVYKEEWERIKRRQEIDLNYRRE
jgi:hypothetical protein